MKFCDNLQKLRKEHHLSQEQLAEQLNVSRQAVSKWESGQTYPEMDKIIAMSKIFDCSLDELVNEEVNLKKEEKKEETKNFEYYKDSFLEFVDTTIEMFSSLSVKEIIRCVITMFIIAIILGIGRVPIDALIHAGYNFFYVLPAGLNVYINALWRFIIDIGYAILFIVLLVYIFKVMFLDKYNQGKFVKVKENKKELKNDEEKISLLKEEKVIKESKVKLNDNYHSMTFLEFLSKLVIYFIKFWALVFMFPLVISLLFLIVCFALGIYLTFQKVFYIGILIGLLASITLNIAFLEILFNFIFNMKHKVKRYFITIIVAIALLGCGVGITSIDIATSEFVDEVPKTAKISTKEQIWPMKDSLFLDLNVYNYDVEYVVDDTLTDKVKTTINYYFNNYELELDEKNGDYYSLHLRYIDDAISFKEVYNIIIKDLQEKEFHNYEKLFTIKVKLTSSAHNIETLKKNEKKYYESMAAENDEVNHLYDEIDKLEEENTRLEDKNYELKEKMDEQKDLYEEKIQEYKDKIQEYKDSVNSLE